MTTRIETDLIGDKEIPNNAYYGVQTKRAMENFTINSLKLSKFPSLIKSLALVKKACADANMKEGKLNTTTANAIMQACDEIVDGKLHDNFIISMVQGGAGTSTNMNANEVIANRALEILGHQKGEYDHVHPNNDVNMSQSTNDVYPTSIKLAILLALPDLIVALEHVSSTFMGKCYEFRNVVKMGRTQLQDAVPMTLGQEFRAFAMTLEEEIARLKEAEKLLQEVNLGGTAIGTGLTASQQYSTDAINALSNYSGYEFKPARNMIEATSDTGVFVYCSGILKRLAVKLSKICNDLRLLSSGPRTGINEINLPAVQPGSSIMPGKVNPVIPEVVNQVAFQVIGNDLTVTMAAEAGQLQLNVMEPVIIVNILQSIDMLKNAMNSLADKCVSGITANEEHARELVERSIGIITAITPMLGYNKASYVAKKALHENKTVRQIIVEEQILTEEEVDKGLDYRAMAKSLFENDSC